MKTACLTIFLLGLIHPNASAVDTENDTHVQKKYSTTRRLSKNAKSKASSSSGSAGSGDAQGKCTLKKQLDCCRSGNRAICILDFGCNIDWCRFCNKDLFKQCCNETGEMLAFCVKDLGCDVTNCPGKVPSRKPNWKPNWKPNKKNKKYRMLLLVESGNTSGEGNERIFK